MPKSPEFNEARLSKAFAFATAQKKPNIAKIAREFNVSSTTLRSRLNKAKQPTTPTPSNKSTLQPYQEKALISWIIQMRKWNLPPPAAIIAAWANQALARAGSDKRVSKMWPYQFEARVPAHLDLAPVRQKTKELKQIQAEDAGLLQH
jgi:transposase-like protein